MNKLMPYFRLMKKSIILMIVITLSIVITNDGKEILTGFKYSEFENGYLILEIGYDQKNELINLFKENNHYENIYSKKDLGENDRIIVATVRR